MKRRNEAGRRWPEPNPTQKVNANEHQFVFIPAVKNGARSTSDGLQVQYFLICGRFIDPSAAESKDFCAQLPQSFICEENANQLSSRPRFFPF
jgi:hypothetical protein